MKVQMLLISATVISFLASPAFAKKPKHAQKHADKHGHNHDYNHKHKRLPPGLRKKLERGGALPPGWQKKVARGEVLDIRVYRHGRVIVPLDRHGAISILVDNRVIRLIKATREILDVFNYR